MSNNKKPYLALSARQKKRRRLEIQLNKSVSEYDAEDPEAESSLQFGEHSKSKINILLSLLIILFFNLDKYAANAGILFMQLD